MTVEEGRVDNGAMKFFNHKAEQWPFSCILERGDAPRIEVFVRVKIVEMRYIRGQIN